MKCDHKSVGILIWKDSKLLLIERKKFPFGFAPPAGHLDGDSFETTAKKEAVEEVGLKIRNLKPLLEKKAENKCRRKDGDWHDWKIFEAEAEGKIKRSLGETKQAGWYSLDEIRKFADRTEDYKKGKVSEDAWQDYPGVEIVWYDWFKKLKIL